MQNQNHGTEGTSASQAEVTYRHRLVDISKDYEEDEVQEIAEGRLLLEQELWKDRFLHRVAACVLLVSLFLLCGMGAYCIGKGAATATENQILTALTGVVLASTAFLFKDAVRRSPQSRPRSNRVKVKSD